MQGSQGMRETGNRAVNAPHRRRIAGVCFLLAVAGPTAAERPRQDPAAIVDAVHQFATRETRLLPGRVSVQVGGVDERLALPACAALDPFLPPGNRLWGTATVGVRCLDPTPWSIYVPVTVRVEGTVLVAARPLAAGTRLEAADLAPLAADLTQLPAGVITDLRDAVGKTVATGIAAGQPLRVEQLKLPPVVMQGQTVKVVAKGRGFVVSAEGRSLTTAGEGQLAQVRMANGQVVSGIARAGAVVEVAY